MKFQADLNKKRKCPICALRKDIGSEVRRIFPLR